MKTKPAFNFIIEIVPMKPSALLQAAGIIQEVNSLARRLQLEQTGGEGLRMNSASLQRPMVDITNTKTAFGGHLTRR